MPRLFSALAQSAAQAAGFENFEPDACLINRYIPGARLTLHQDKDENEYSAPIVSVSFRSSRRFPLRWHPEEGQTTPNPVTTW